MSAFLISERFCFVPNPCCVYIKKPRTSGQRLPSRGIPPKKYILNLQYINKSLKTIKTLEGTHF